MRDKKPRASDGLRCAVEAGQDRTAPVPIAVASQCAHISGRQHKQRASKGLRRARCAAGGKQAGTSTSTSTRGCCLSACLPDPLSLSVPSSLPYHLPSSPPSSSPPSSSPRTWRRRRRSRPSRRPASPPPGPSPSPHWACPACPPSPPPSQPTPHTPSRSLGIARPSQLYGGGSSFSLPRFPTSLPAGPRSGSQRKNHSLVKTTVNVLIRKYPQLFCPDSQLFCELQPEFTPWAMIGCGPYRVLQ
eukprot:COSAG02_NODE_2968_length_7640_cov_10.957831_4_plen_245_part_00